jgi:hypothetical protein
MHGRGRAFTRAFGLLSPLSMKLADGSSDEAKGGGGVYRVPKVAFSLALLLSVLLPGAAGPEYRAALMPKLLGIAYYGAVKRGVEEAARNCPGWRRSGQARRGMPCILASIMEPGKMK